MSIALRRSSIAALFLGASLLFTPVVAQTPSHGHCTLEPVSLPLFDATPAAEAAASPVVAAEPGNVHETEIGEALALIVDCINSDDPAYQYAIFTEHYLAVQFSDATNTYQPQFEQQIAQGPTGERGRFELRDVSEVEALDDGRVSAVVELSNGVTTFRDTVILVKVGEVWLIDEIEVFEPPVQ